jgi:hypothetical protein
VIYGNSADYGSAISFYYSYAKISDCIITNNIGAEAIDFCDSSADLTYCDFYNNSSGNFAGYYIPANLGVITHTNYNDDSCDIYNNIFLDPAFYSTVGDSAFYLTQNSPCIDAGDPTSPFDPDGTIADIGAYYFDQNLPQPLSGSLNGILNHHFYIVTADIFVSQNNSLTISPGATFLFQGPYSFTISGYLSAEGTEADSIVFQPDSGVTAWRGIIFDSTANDNSALEYCVVTGCDTAGISIRGSSPTIAYSTISGNSGVIGGGLQLENGASPTIDHCLISDNYGVMGGGIFLFQSNPMIRNCTIAGNSADVQFGGGISVNNSNPTIVNNIIANCASGYGIFSDSPNNNLSIIYNDFFGNIQADLHNINIAGLGVISTVNSNGDSCDIYQNLFLDPQFVNASNGDFSLESTSPCIDAGDPTSHFDPDNTFADIGAYYYNQSGVEDSEFIIHHSSFIISAFPNPFNSSVVISFELRDASLYDLAIFDINGREVWRLASGISHLGTNEVEWDAKGMPSGIYFARLSVEGSRSAVQKMLLLK